MGLSVKTVSEGGVVLKVEGTNVHVVGSIDCPNPGKFMEPFFTELHQNIIEEGIKDVKLNIRRLNFLNSSGIREFVDWVLKIEDLEEDKQYNITFVCNTEHLWQESSISTIIFLNQEHLRKETI